MIDILQPCVSFNHRNTHAWYKERVYRLDTAGHDPASRTAAFEKAHEWGERIPIGVIYRADKPAFEEQLPALRNGPLVKQGIDPGRVEALLREFQ